MLLTHKRTLLVKTKDVKFSFPQAEKKKRKEREKSKIA
jgi:hypothetical protein